MAQLSNLQTYDKGLREDLHELAENLWLGQPINGTKAGNLRAIYYIIDLTGISAGTTFGIRHALGEVPLAYVLVGTPETHLIPLSPGTDASGVVIPWTATRLYLKAPSHTNLKVCIMVWAGDSLGQ